MRPNQPNSPEDDLDLLLGELDAHIDFSAAQTSDDPASIFRAWVGAVAHSRGSDLFLVSGSPPMMRVDGALVALNAHKLTPEQVESIVLPVMEPEAIKRYRQQGIA